MKRHQFLCCSLASLAGASIGCWGGGSKERLITIPLQVPEIVQGRTFLGLLQLVLTRRGNHVRAMSQVCTHQRCNLKLMPGGFQCPCHGAQFDKEGRVLKGPATEDLPHFELSLSREGELRVHLGKITSSEYWFDLQKKRPVGVD